MGWTNETPNIALPQFVDSDKPTWRGDFNYAMGVIDAAIADKVGRGEIIVDPRDHGLVVDDPTAAVANLAALDEAATAAAGGTLFVPPGATHIEGGWSLAGYSCSLMGVGSDMRAGVAGRSVFQAVNQSGPVIDFTDYDWGENFRGLIPFRDFAVAGDGVANIANIGIRFHRTINGDFDNIAISNTGGPGIDGDIVYFTNFDGIRIVAPINANTNDVPYAVLRNAAGCEINFSLYSGLNIAESVGASGAVLIIDDGLNSSNRNYVDLLIENLHPPTNGTYLHSQAWMSTYSVRDYDSPKLEGATNVSAIRLAPTTALGEDRGGNQVIGTIPGYQEPLRDFGVDVQQSNNRIDGVRGFRGANVRIAPGVEYTYVNLGGAQGSVYDDGIIDESMLSTNTLLDWVSYPAVGYENHNDRRVTTTITEDTVLSVDPDLVLPVVGGAKYEFTATIRYRSTADLQLSLDIPADATIEWVAEGAALGAIDRETMSVTRTIHQSGGVAVVGGLGAGPANETHATISGVVSTSSSGSIGVMYAQNVSNTENTTILYGSYVTIKRVV